MKSFLEKMDRPIVALAPLPGRGGEAAAELHRLRRHFAAIEILLRTAEAELQRISPLPPPAHERRRAQQILRLVCAEWAVSLEALRCRARPERYTQPRQVAAFLLYQHCDLTTKEIADLLARKDHSTIVYSVKKIKTRRAIEAPFAARLARLEKTLAPYGGQPSTLNPQPSTAL